MGRCAKLGQPGANARVCRGVLGFRLFPESSILERCLGYIHRAQNTVACDSSDDHADGTQEKRLRERHQNGGRIGLELRNERQSEGDKAVENAATEIGFADFFVRV